MQKSAAARQHDALLHDVRGQLGRRAVEGDLDSVDDGRDRLLDRSADLLGCRDDSLRKACDEVAAADLGVQLFLELIGRSERDLDLFSRPLTESEAVLLLDERDDRLVKLVSADPDRLADDDAAERYHRDFCRAATDVHDHVAGRLVDGQTCTDRGRHRLLDDVGLASACILGGFLHGTLLDPGDARRHADHHAWLGEPVRVHTADEVAQHHLADLEVRYHPVLQGSDRLDVARGPADHPFGLDADSERMAVLDVDGYDGGLVEHDPAAADIHERVRSTEVYGHVTTDEGEPALRHTSAPGLDGVVPPGYGMHAQVTRAALAVRRDKPASTAPDGAHQDRARARPGEVSVAMVTVKGPSALTPDLSESFHHCNDA